MFQFVKKSDTRLLGNCQSLFQEWLWSQRLIPSEYSGGPAAIVSATARRAHGLAGSQGVRLRFFNGDVLVQQGLRGDELRRLKGFLGRNPSLLFICESEYQFLITALVAQAPIAIKRGQTTFSSLPASKQSWATAPG